MGEHRKLNKMEEHNKIKQNETTQKKLNKMGQHEETKQNRNTQRN